MQSLSYKKATGYVGFRLVNHYNSSRKRVFPLFLLRSSLCLFLTGLSLSLIPAYAGEKDTPPWGQQAIQQSSAGASLKVQVSKEMLHHVEQKNCETWVVPEKGFVESCETIDQLVEQNPEPEENEDLEALSPLEFNPEQNWQAEEEPGHEDVIQTVLSAATQALQNTLSQIITPALEELHPVIKAPEVQSSSAEPVAQADVLQTLEEVKPSIPQVLLVQTVEPVWEAFQALRLRLASELGPNQESQKTEKPLASNPLDTPAPEGERVQATYSPATLETGSSEKRSRKQQSKWPRNPISFVLKHVLRLLP